MMVRESGTSTRRALKRAFCAVALLAAPHGCGAPARSPGTAVIASGADLESGNPLVTVHPLSRQLQRHALFVTLVKFDSLLQPQPYYARAWSWDATRNSVHFRLATTVRWHDGYPTTAHDVAFTIGAAKDPDVGSPRAGDLAGVDSTTVTSDSTIVIHFAKPQSSLPAVFAELPIAPRHRLDTVPRARWRSSTFATAPVGNGPFRFVSHLAGRQWRFARNANFPHALGGPPQLRQLIVAVVDEAATKFAGLVSGELDLAGIAPSMADLVTRDPTLELLSPPALFSIVLAFNTTRPPFADSRVRRAISALVNRPRLIEAAVAGYATPARSAIPPGLPFSPESAARTAGAHPDVRGASALLDAAGYTRTGSGLRARNGVPLRMTLLTVGSGDMAVEQLVQADLATHGIHVEIRVMELATLLAAVRAPEKTFDVVLTGIPGDIALGHLSAMFATAQRGGALDYTGFHSASLDTALTRAREATPNDARTAWERVNTLVQQEMPVAWLYHARGVQGKSRALQHVRMDLRGELVSVAEWTRQETP